MKSRAKVGALAAVVLMAPALGFLAASPAGAAAAAPAVTAVTPASGPSVTSSTASATTPGGTAVTITGSNFTGATAVHFGSAAATGVTVVSATTITATSPTIANSIGNTVDVTVTTPGGTSATSVNDEFTYPYNYTSAGAVHEASISLSASSPSALVNGSITLTATAPTDVGPSLDFGLSIVDVTNAAAPVAVAHVPSGTTVSASVGEVAAQTRRYVAAFDACTVFPASCPPGALETPIANDGGVSAPVTVTWTAPAPPPATGGYTLVASDGGIFNYGNAAFLRLGRGHPPERTRSWGWRPTPDGKGYWLVASDGGIFNYGDARYYGSAGAIHLNKPIVGHGGHGRRQGLLAGGLRRRDLQLRRCRVLRLRRGHPSQQAHRGHGGHADGKGYWLVASDGGIFNYGDAAFHGSAGAIP